MTRLAEHRLQAAQGMTAGGTLQRVFGAVYGGQMHRTMARDCDLAKAPARGGGRAPRGGATHLDSARGAA